MRTDEDELALWHAKAKAKGLTLSELIRRSLSDIRIRSRRTPVPAVPADLLRALARLGNNLNQIARWCNRDKADVDSAAVLARLIEIDRELSLLRSRFESLPHNSDEV